MGGSMMRTLEDRLLRLRNLEPETGSAAEPAGPDAGCRGRCWSWGRRNGYSTIWLAEAAPRNGGRVTSVEMDPERTAQAATNLARAQLAEFVDLHVGDAATVLRDTRDATVDLVFLDAERPEYPAYWPDLTRVLRRPGLLAIDNAISHAHELVDFAKVVDADERALTALDQTGAGVLLVSLPA